MSLLKAVELLAQKRKCLGLSRSLVSRLLKVPETTLWRWENGVHKPSIYYRDKIRKLLGIIEEIQEKYKKGEQ